MTVHLVHLDDLYDAVTPDMLDGAHDVLSFVMNEKRGEIATCDLEIRSIGVQILQRATYVCLIEVDDVTGAQHVICRARIVKMPTDFKAQTLILQLVCAPSGFPAQLRAAADTACNGAAIPPWVVKIIPQPQPVVGVIFSASPGSAAAYAKLRGTAAKVGTLFQRDLVRTPYARVSWNVITVANALVTATLPLEFEAAARAAAQAGLYAWFGLSDDDLAEHTDFYTYGKVMRVGIAPGGAGVEVEVNMADPSLTGSGFATEPGDPTKSGLPFYDALFGGQDDPTTAALEGRSASWHVDPVTHAITLEDWQAGAVIDLGGLGDESSTEYLAGASPVNHVRMRVIAEWEQQAFGAVDISSVIATAASPSGYITTLQDRVKEGGSDPKLDFKSWGGWTKGTWTYSSFVSQSAPFFTGRTAVVTYRTRTFVPPPTEGDGAGKPGTFTYSDPWTQSHAESGTLNVRNIHYDSAWVSYEYRQPRRDVVDLSLDTECQDTVLNDDVAVLPTITLSDLMNVAGISPFSQGTVYNKGDRVTVLGHAWECIQDGVIRFYELVTKASRGFGGLSVRVSQEPIYWKDLGTLAPITDPRIPSFFDTPRGFGCLQHALMRMRACALKRMEMVHVSRTYEWHRCRDITLHDRVRLEVRNGDTGVLPMIGKVIGITRSLPEAGPATVRLKVAVCLGTGRNDVAAVAGGDEYGSSDYVDPTYSPVSQPVYLAASAQAEDISFGVHGDVEAVLRPGPLVTPVDATRLSDPWYAVGECFVDSQADLQMAVAMARLQSGSDPRAVVRDYPTTLQVGMRLLPMTNMIERQYECHAVLTVSPRGVNMDGGEP